jgi:hypothetical protein
LQASKGTRIRQGGPDEDKALAAHVLELTPSPQLLTEAAQLCELLILLRHEGDAGILQQVWPGSSPFERSLACPIQVTAFTSAERALPGYVGSWPVFVLRLGKRAAIA